MSISVRERQTESGEKFLKELKKLEKKQVKAGFFAGRAKSEEGTDYVDIANFNEYGTVNIPSRPFMRDSVDKHEIQIDCKILEAKDALLSGAAAREVLSFFGELQQNLIQDEITNGDFVSNAPSTLKRKEKKRAPGNSDPMKPLIDTGRMRQSVHYKVVEKGGGDS